MIKNRLTGDETPQETLTVLREHVDAFYNTLFSANVGGVAHAFIEFCGVMNEYLGICGDVADAGIDFRRLNGHGLARASVEAHRAAYLQEKLNCIFAPFGRVEIAFNSAVEIADSVGGYSSGVGIVDAGPGHDDSPVYREDAPPCRVLWISDGKRSRVIDHVGEDFDRWVEDIGWCHAFDDSGPGVWIAQGSVCTWQDRHGEWDSELDTTSARPLTRDEWAMYLEGELEQGPWDRSKWMHGQRAGYHPTDLPDGWE